MSDDGPVFDPAKFAAAAPRSAAPVFDPAKFAAAGKTTEPEGMSASDVLSGVIENAPASAWQFAKDVAHPFMHPIETAGAIKDLALGVAAKGAQYGILPEVPQFSFGAPTNAERAKTADALGGYLKDRYGGLENIKRTVAKDPVGALSDASMVLTGGGAGAARLPGIAGKVGEVTANVGRTIDPLMAPVNIAKGGTKAVGELMTHTGSTPLETAYRTGVEGGEAGEVFRGHMRGTDPMTDAVDMAKRGLEGYRKTRAENYRKGMGEITTLDRQIDPLDRILDFGKIDNAVDEALKVQTFGGRRLDKGADAVRSEMLQEIASWKAEPNKALFHTIEGLDALKRSLGNMMMGTQPGTPARKAAGEIYHAVKNTITQYDPKYAKVMKDYELASNQIRELERAMSLGEKASADTALRKLQSIMRNNVNTNYGRRLELGKLLEENGATHLMAALAGQSANAWFPRGLGKLAAEASILTGAHHAGSGGLGSLAIAAATTPFMSPRLMAETAHATGRVIGRPLAASNRTLGKIGLTNRAAGNISYRLGRTTRPADYDKPLPFARGGRVPVSKPRMVKQNGFVYHLQPDGSYR